jgi:hypothetical protein
MQDSNTICQVSFMNNFLAHLVRRPLTFHILIFSSETPQPNELKLGRELLWKVVRCFLSSFGSFGQAVSEEKFLKIGQSETRIACGGHVC